MNKLQRTLIGIRLSRQWSVLLHLRKKGTRRMEQGVSYQDKKLRQWSARITEAGINIRRLEQQYLD